MSACEHEPSVTLTFGQEFVESVICQCVKCGEMGTLREGRWFPSLRLAPASTTATALPSPPKDPGRVDG